MKKQLFILFIFTTLLFLNSIYTQEKIKLEYKFEKGKTYFYTDTTIGDMTQEMMGREMKMKNESRSLIRIFVDNTDKEKKSTLMVSVDSVIVHTSNQMFDTTMRIKEIEGKRTKIVVSNLGKILSRETIDSIKVTGRMAAMANREAISFPILSDKELKIGEKWKSIDADTSGPINNTQLIITKEIEYTLAGKEKRNGYECYKVTYSGTTSTEGKMNMQGMEFYIEGTGKIEGSFYFAQKIGLIIQNENKVESEMTYASTGENPMTIPVSQKIITKRALIK